MAATGCGGGEEEAAAPEETPTPTPSATATRTPDAREPPQKARSVKDCVEIWNRDEVAGSTSQVSATDFLADLATERRTPVQVAFKRRGCIVTAPIGGGRVATFVTVPNHAFYDLPERQRIPEGARLPTNARATEDGRIVLR